LRRKLFKRYLHANKILNTFLAQLHMELGLKIEDKGKKINKITPDIKTLDDFINLALNSSLDNKLYKKYLKSAITAKIILYKMLICINILIIFI